MRTFIFITIISCLMSVSAYAQQGDGVRNDRMEAQKVAFITQKLNLTSVESQNFWPIYNEYQAENKAIAQQNENKRPDLMNMSDQEAQNLFDKLLDSEYQKLEIRKKYADKMMNVIGPKRVLMLIHIEDQFKRKLLQNFKNRMDQRKGGERSRNGGE